MQALGWFPLGLGSVVEGESYEHHVPLRVVHKAGHLSGSAFCMGILCM